MRLLEDEVEQAALTWFKELNYSIAHAPYLAPGEIAAERTSFSDVVLVGRARDAITRLNPTIPSEAREEAIAHACGDSRYAPAEVPEWRTESNGSRNMNISTITSTMMMAIAMAMMMTRTTTTTTTRTTITTTPAAATAISAAVTAAVAASAGASAAL